MPRLSRDVVPRAPEDTSWQEADLHVASAADVSHIVSGRITYVPDMFEEDEWREPMTTWQMREGDCEDIASMVAVLCARKDIDAEVVIVHSGSARKAHAIATGTTRGGVWISSNGRYTEHHSMFDAKHALARDLGWSHDDIQILQSERHL